MRIESTLTELTLNRGTCLDCRALGGCAEILKILKTRGVRYVLDHHCEKWKTCTPSAARARETAIHSVGVLALRGMIERHTNKEDPPVTRTEREAELKGLNRMKLRQVAMEAGFDHTKSLKAKSEEMIEHVLTHEFPDETVEEPAKKAPARKAAARRTPAKKAAAEETAQETPGDVATYEVLIDALGQVLDSHGATLDEVQSSLDGLQKLLVSFLYMSLEPEAVEAVLADAGIEVPEDPS